MGIFYDLKLVEVSRRESLIICFLLLWVIFNYWIGIFGVLRESILVFIDVFRMFFFDE